MKEEERHLARLYDLHGGEYAPGPEKVQKLAQRHSDRQAKFASERQQIREKLLATGKFSNYTTEKGKQMSMRELEKEVEKEFLKEFGDLI